MIHLNFISAALLGFLTVHERGSRATPEMFARLLYPIRLPLLLLLLLLRTEKVLVTFFIYSLQSWLLQSGVGLSTVTVLLH